MARPNQWGWECGVEVTGGGGFTGRDCVVAPSTGGARMYSNSTTATFIPAGSLRSGYFQLRVKVEKMPSDGNSRQVIFELRNAITNPSGMPGIILDGATQSLEFRNYASNPVAADAAVMGTFTGIQAGVWYFLEWRTQMNTATQTGTPGTETNAQLDAWLDVDAQAFTYAPGGSLSSAVGLHVTTGAFQSTVIGSTPLAGTASATNAIVCFDDFILDTVNRCENEHVFALWPTAVGTYTSWSNQAWGFCRHINSNNACASAVANARVSYLLPTLRSKGVTGTTAGNLVKVNIGNATASGAAQIFVRVNGVETATAVNFTASSTVQNPRTAEFALMLAPDDVVEIGYQKDNSVTSRWFSQFFLEVSVRDADYNPEPIVADVASATAAYTGTGATLAQFVTLPFIPDVILVVPISGTTSRMPVVWESNTYSAQSGEQSTLGFNGIVWAPQDVAGCYVTSTMNTVGETYELWAISDPARRMIQLGDFTSNDQSPVTLPDPTFTPDFLYVMNQATASTGACGVHGTTAVDTNWATYILGTNFGGVPDYIPSVSMGTFTTGVNADLLHSLCNPYVAFNTSRFNTTPLIEMVAWTGNGSSPRVLPVTNASATVRGVLVLPLAFGAGANGRRGHIRTASFTGSNSRHLSGTSGVVTTGITAMSVGSFTVGADANLSAQPYEALVLYAGTDLDQVAVPDLLGLTLIAATAVLTATDLVVGTVTTVGVVVDQTPDAGTMVDFFSAVDLVLDGPPALTNPGPQTSTEYLPDTLQLLATPLNSGPLTYGATGLPPGLSLNTSTGLISGTCMKDTEGTYSVTVTATSSWLFTATEVFTWTVVPNPIVITPPTLPDAMTLHPYSQQLTATGGAGGPFTTFQIIAGALPPGLSLSSDGLISGTPTVDTILGPAAWPNGLVDVFYSEQLVVLETGVGGTSAFTVRVTDILGDDGETGEQAFTLLLLSGWTQSPFFEVVADTMPKCLTCTPSGLIRGYPMTVGVFPVTVQVTSALGNTVQATATLTVTS